MATILHGSTLVEEPMVCTWKIGTGGQTRRSFKGTSSEITNKANELQVLGYETEITTGPKWSLTATVNVDLTTNPNGDTVNNEPEPVPQWELVPHIKEQSIYECERPFVLALNSDIKACIENKLKNQQNKSIFVVPSGVTNSLLIAKALRVYMYKQAGMEGRAINILSLKRSILVSSNYRLNWSINNAMKVISDSKLKALYAPPTAIYNILPDTYASTEYVYYDVNAQFTLEIPFYYGWLEMHPSYQTVGNNKIQISQEWTYGKYTVGDNGMYDLLV